MTKYTIISSILVFFFGGTCLGLINDTKHWDYGYLTEEFPWDGAGTTDNLECTGNTDLGNCTSVKEDEKGGRWTRNTIIRRLLSVFGLNADKMDDLKFIDYLRAILNIALGLVAFIALIITIYTFYMMIFSENEAGIKRAKQNLLGIFIALAIIGLAWLIVSFIFWWYQEYWESAEENIQVGNVTMIGEKLHNNQIYLTV